MNDGCGEFCNVAIVFCCETICVGACVDFASIRASNPLIIFSCLTQLLQDIHAQKPCVIVDREETFQARQSP